MSQRPPLLTLPDTCFPAPSLFRSPVRFYGQYLVEVPALPDSEQQRRHYDEVLSRLARERQYGIVRRLYPRLPGADRSAMASVSLPAPKQVAYRPVTWEIGRAHV